MHDRHFPQLRHPNIGQAARRSANHNHTTPVRELTNQNAYRADSSRYGSILFKFFLANAADCCREIFASRRSGCTLQLGVLDGNFQVVSFHFRQQLAWPRVFCVPRPRHWVVDISLTHVLRRSNVGSVADRQLHMHASARCDARKYADLLKCGTGLIFETIIPLTERIDWGRIVVLMWLMGELICDRWHQIHAGSSASNAAAIAGMRCCWAARVVSCCSMDDRRRLASS